MDSSSLEEPAPSGRNAMVGESLSWRALQPMVVRSPCYLKRRTLAALLSSVSLEEVAMRVCKVAAVAAATSAADLPWKV